MSSTNNDQWMTYLSALATARLSADAFFADIPIFEEARGIIADEVTQALSVMNSKNGKAGAVVIVKFPVVKRNDSEAPVTELMLNLVVACHVDNAINMTAGGTGKTVDQMWANVVRVLHTWKSQFLGRTLSLSKDTPMKAYEIEGELVNEAHFLTPYFMPRRAKCNLGNLVVEHVSGTIYRAKATTTTEGAAIFYNLVPQTEMPTLPVAEETGGYESGEWVEFDVTEPSWLFAVAYKDGMIASDDVSASIDLL